MALANRRENGPNIQRKLPKIKFSVQYLIKSIFGDGEMECALFEISKSG